MMNEFKNSCSKEIMRLIELSCMRIARKTKPVIHLLHMTNEELLFEIDLIIDTLPDYYFDELESEYKEDFVNLFSRHYLFFGMNKKDENRNDPSHLDQFILLLSGKIRDRYF